MSVWTKKVYFMQLIGTVGSEECTEMGIGRTGRRLIAILLLESPPEEQVASLCVILKRYIYESFND